MNTSSSSTSLYYQRTGVTPKKSPTTENVQKRRKDLEKSERAAYWALFNSLIAVLLYYDLCYLNFFSRMSILLNYAEWLVCAIFTTSAFYDFSVHFWPYTIMKPIKVSPTEKRLLGIQDDEFGFKVEESPRLTFEPIYDNLPPFEIHHSFEEDERVVTPQRKQSTPDSSINTSRRSRVVDKESLVEYLKNCQIFEDEMAELREAEMKQNHC